MVRYLVKLGFFLLPVLAVFLTELFVLPIDYFTFRCWEALVADSDVLGLSGPFYPNQHLIKQEAGDYLGFQDPGRRKAEWYTDEFGFRNRPCTRPVQQYDYVLVGDSNIVGSALDQAETLAEVLARKGKCSTYSYSGGLQQKKYFWSDPRFLTPSPKVIVVEARPGEFYKAASFTWITSDPCELPQAAIPALPMCARILVSRAHRQVMLQFAKSRIKSALYGANHESDEKDLGPTERVEFMVSKIVSMQAEARRRGSDFIFMLMPGGDRSLDAGIVKLREMGVKTIAYLPTAKYPHGVNMNWYYQVGRDSHWTKEAVEMTAEQILELAKR
jgi:hypothetical protein